MRTRDAAPSRSRTKMRGDGGGLLRAMLVRAMSGVPRTLYPLSRTELVLALHAAFFDIASLGRISTWPSTGAAGAFVPISTYRRFKDFLSSKTSSFFPAESPYR